ncbi:hypothetical protein JOB18_006672 [Solea senegalensis]|uniref:Uncharacterized protein n=1 Tax=Solea senegalensis TaxID=28829 RepID=A0AAV6QK94_SOLSE|nr:hypothetical protein JOB18_006672 [Solea senegalensis]
MCGEVRVGPLLVTRVLDVRLSRTCALLLFSLVTMATWLQPPVHAQVEIDALREGVVLAEAGGRGELEASMSSSLLQEFREVTERIGAMEGGAQQNSAPPTAFPDSSAVVGRVFQMKVPNKMEDVYVGDVVESGQQLSVVVRTCFCLERSHWTLAVCLRQRHMTALDTSQRHCNVTQQRHNDSVTNSVQRSATTAPQ